MLHVRSRDIHVTQELTAIMETEVPMSQNLILKSCRKRL
jgi:hypothetical protein